MRKNNLITIFALLALVASSCKKNFIELSPQDQPSSATFFQTASQFQQALVAAYTPLRDLMTNDFYTGEMRSDNTHYQFYQVNRGTAYVYRENIADFTDQAIDDYTNAVYFHCYHGISRANIVIQRIATATIADSSKRRIDGEAKFLRAFNYFKLVRYFGAVPLYLKEIDNVDDAFLPRTTFAVK